MNGDIGKDFAHGDLTGRVLQAAFEVSNQLGCGFLENVYENALSAELSSRGMEVSRQVPIRVIYKNQTVGEYRADLIVESQVLVEVKATIEHHKLYVAQTLNYLRATGLGVGLLLNFGRPKLMYRRLVLSGATEEAEGSGPL
ncbi:MAG: GxxExxY protein [Phycisphaerae bacterium]